LNDSDFANQVELHRRSKDEALRSEPWSPIPPADRRGFAGLAYYPADARWAVKVHIARLPRGEVLAMATSTGETRTQVRYARLTMATPNGPVTLFAYKDARVTHTDTLFVPFRDATSGNETYGAGRYLDLEEPPGDEMVVDFNQAYNPYCAYSDAYSCPLPPAENWLKVAVTAGEKVYPHR
jgi:uncharacterized protein (DUF1684 family)